jgi:hypothetical protein
MNKLFFLFALLLLSVLAAKEPTLAILTSVSSNSIQRFNIGMASFECKLYGVVVIDDLYKNASMDSSCKKKVEEFYKRNPNAKFSSSNVLKIMQMYHLEFKDKGCVLYANGQTTLSEMLLAEGLAFIKRGFQDDEFHTLFYKAQENAKLSKIGLWEENILKDCMVEAYKE